MPDTFQTVFCREFDCPPEAFEEQVFWKCLPSHAKIVARLLMGRRETFFREDFGLIREIASVACRDVVITELNRFHGRNLRDKNWARRLFKIRISGGKLRKLSVNLLARP